MPVYKKINKKGKVSWYCSFYYQDYDGERKQKKKEGFKTQRSAKEYEQDFLQKYNNSSSMRFELLAEYYLADMKLKDKPTTYHNKEYIISKKLAPFFGKMPINLITPADIKQWQRATLSKVSVSTSRVYHTQLVSIFNYAMQIYGLKENVAKKAGYINGKNKGQKELKMWTIEQFKLFDVVMSKDLPELVAGYRAIFNLLFYSGMRIGEALALTPEDIDYNGRTISINKTFSIVEKKPVITSPKTKKSKRVLSMPVQFMDMLNNFIKANNAGAGRRIFNFTTNNLRRVLKKYAEKAGVPEIRLHDLRHSHASMLIEKGFSPVAVRDRLGHERIEITLQTYSHLYPNKQHEIANTLGKIFDGVLE